MNASTLHHRRDTCRVCGNAELTTFLELGPQPLANAYLRSPAEFAGEGFFPLDVCVCRKCSLVQTPNVIDPAVLFADYVYRTGMSASMNDHFRSFAKAVVDNQRLGRNDLVVEIASNDGTLLKHFQKLGVKTLGIEPAKNLAAESRAAGVDTLDLFFDSKSAAAIRAERRPARVVIANNVLAHVDDPVDFLRGARALLAENGRLVVEVPYLRDLIDHLEYDTIYHEHLCYFALAPLVYACGAAQFDVVRVDRLAVHGGSLRVHAVPARGRGHDESVQRMIDEERTAGLLDVAYFKKFATRVRAHREKLLGMLTKLHREGASIAAYGAPAKGNTLLNWCAIGSDLVEFTVDRNPGKVGCFTPGMHLPIKPVAALLERQPDYVLVLPWNLFDEIVSQQGEYARRGGQFILPVPKPKVVIPKATKGAA